MRLIAWILLFVGVILGCSCQREKLPDPLPEMSLTVTPSTGKTTDILMLKAEPITGQSDKDKFYFRWDWDGDDNWDTNYSTSTMLDHRYRIPGNYVLRVEMTDGQKQVRTDSVFIIIEQGYSPPHALFSVTPDSGNYLTDFVFDASLTTDDEDSLHQLRFRWNFQGSGFSGEGYPTGLTLTNRYSRPGIYRPQLEVRDPSGLVSIFTGEVSVTAIDTLIYADFTYSGEPIRVRDTIILDASSSVYIPEPSQPLEYSWFLPDRMEWTIPSVEPIMMYVIRNHGVNLLQLKVTNTVTSLYNICKKVINAGDEDLPPVARIQVGSANGNILTQFYFDSWASTDDNQMPSELFVRWDFDGDGYWDTPFSTEKTIYYQYNQPGDYQAKLQVRDHSLLTGIDVETIYVSANQWPTGFFRDMRDGQFYGTVTLEQQTWMSSNLNFTIPQKQEAGVKQWICLNDQDYWCQKVGKLYRINAVIENRSDDEYVPICPTGWRLPSREDWEELFLTIGGKTSLKELRYGGLYDFNGLDLGFVEWHYKYLNGIVVDTLYLFEETFQSMHYFSTTEPFDPTGTRIDSWMWSVDRYSGEPWTGFDLPRFFMPVRCIKEN